MSKFTKGLVLAFGLAMASTTSHAVTFDFTGVNERDAPSKTFVEDGITLTVTAGTFDARSNPSDIDFGARRVDLDPDGLGADGGFFDSDQIDGALGNDVLAFSFSEDVILNTISFGNVDRNDHFAFGVVDGASFERFVDFEDVLSPVAASTFLTLTQRTGDSFGIGAIGFFSNFTIAGLDVTRVVATPLPPTLLMLGSVLVGFGFLGYRRRRAVRAV